jgi:hypothetical protein
MDISTLKCDECGKLRINDSNHWLEGTADGRMIKVAAVGYMEAAEEERKKHFCGQACAMKWLGAKIGEL